MMDLWIVFVLGLATASVSDKLLVSSQSPVPSSPSSQADDLYLEGHPSGDLPVDDEGDDDDDIASGSGDFSGDFFHHDVTLTDPKVLFDIFEVTPARPGVTQSTPPNPPTTAEDRRDPPTTAEDSVTSSDVFPEKEEDSEVVPAAEEPTADWSDATTSPTSASPPPPPPPTETVPSREAGGEGVLTKKEDGVQLEGGAGGRMLDLETPEEGVTSESLWERTEVLAAIIACGVVAFLCALCLFLLLAYRMKKKDEGSYDLGVTKVPPTAYQKAPTKEFYA